MAIPPLLSLITESLRAFTNKQLFWIVAPGWCLYGAYELLQLYGDKARSRKNKRPNPGYNEVHRHAQLIYLCTYYPCEEAFQQEEQLAHHRTSAHEPGVYWLCDDATCRRKVFCDEPSFTKHLKDSHGIADIDQLQDLCNIQRRPQEDDSMKKMR